MNRSEGQKIIGFDVESVKNRFYSLQLYSEDIPVGFKIDNHDVPMQGYEGNSFYTENSSDIGEMFRYGTRGALFFGTFSEIDTYWISKWLTSHGFTIRLVWLGSRLLWAKVTKRHNVWRICDTLNLFPKRSVEALGKIIGLEKLPKPEYLGERAPNENEKETFIRYALRDPEIVYKVVSKVRNEFGFMKATLPSMALRYWMMLQEPLSYNNDDKPFYLSDAMRYNAQKTFPELVSAQFDAYHGGRVESLGRGTWIDEVYVYDFRSMYPSVMAGEYSYPDVRRLPKVVKGRFMLDDFEGYEGVVKANFTQDTFIPPIGQNTILKGEAYPRLVFANGNRTNIVTLAELRYLEEYGYGHVNAIYKGQIWTDGLRLFDDYVKNVWDLRLKYRGKDEVLSDFYKLLMNSLYGKFGEHIKTLTQEVQSDGSIKTVIDDPISEDFSAASQDKGMNKLAPVIAAYTTAYARIKLHKEIMRYDGEDVVYCDTDSLHTLHSHPSTDAQDLGTLEWKYGRKINRATYIRAKAYLTDNLITWKGLPLRAVINGKVIDADSIRGALIDGEDAFTVTIDKMLRWRDAYRRGLEPYARIFEPKSFTFSSDKKRIYDKRLNGETLISDNTLSKPLNTDDLI